MLESLVHRALEHAEECRCCLVFTTNALKIEQWTCCSAWECPQGVVGSSRSGV